MKLPCSGKMWIVKTIYQLFTNYIIFFMNALYQRSSTLFLGTHDPEEFSYNPNQTHLKRTVKLLETAWHFQAGVLKPVGNKLSRSRVKEDLCFIFFPPFLLLMHVIWLMLGRWGCGSSRWHYLDCSAWELPRCGPEPMIWRIKRLTLSTNKLQNQAWDT